MIVEPVRSDRRLSQMFVQIVQFKVESVLPIRSSSSCCQPLSVFGVFVEIRFAVYILDLHRWITFWVYAVLYTAYIILWDYIVAIHCELTVCCSADCQKLDKEISKRFAKRLGKLQWWLAAAFCVRFRFLIGFQLVLNESFSFAALLLAHSSPGIHLAPSLGRHSSFSRTNSMHSIHSVYSAHWTAFSPIF